ncbi:putative hydrolase [Caenibius tardaugens NBRC 16725]|uniref:Putative hydrolase n=1 Tax=Caenibius tardaugens NBRC 16725 TaxID=1219035 RepID=U2ZPY0_9SPHN|nr:amidohydrolase family protein [Caenibius tardaugens]AZI37326.1 D-aminoacylase [Caenibius tardaugens NBRC 16725]GAD47419.1 putative hydrolase [Caenibius tardaugens NBRC 16725]
MLYETVIRNGMIVDGSGNDPYIADIAISAGKIVAIGTFAGQGAEEFDAAGKLVTPGFVDIHTHYDGQITWEQRMRPSSDHGVTTVVMGNCGVGFAPCRPHQRDMLVEVMEGVEDIPEVVMTEGLPWNWESFPEYLDVLAGREADVDFAAQVPHSPVRVFVMGERGAARVAATSDELQQMREIVREGVAAGALGVTTSRNHGHRTVAGELAPSVDADRAELLALAGGLADAGTGVFQMIPNSHYGDDPQSDMALFRDIVATSGRPLSFSLLQKKYQRDLPETMLAMLKDYNADNATPIRAQVFPRPIGMLFGLELSFHPFRFHPSFQAIADLPLAEKVSALREPDLRARLLAETPVTDNPLYMTLASDVADLYPMGNPPNYEPAAASRLGARAQEEGRNAAELALDALLEQDGRGLLMMPSSNYVDGNLDMARRMISDPNTIIALGDGGAHYSLICDSSFPTFVLTHWVRDRTEGRLPLAWAVRQLSHEPARAVGLDDRGLLRPGYKADINVIDPERLELPAPTIVYDLPAGGRRLIQQAKGYELTMVSGMVTYRNGEASGALPGRFVRGAQSAPLAA